MTAADVIRKYGAEYNPEKSQHPRELPASTRIIEAVCLIEKGDRQRGQYWMAMLFEFKRWIELTHEARLRAEGRLVDSPQPRTE